LVAPKLGSETKILSLAVHDSKLYGGTYPNGKLYEWNDSDAWAEVAPQLAAETYAYALKSHNGNLYGATGLNGKLYEWNGTTSWGSVASQLGSETQILSLAIIPVPPTAGDIITVDFTGYLRMRVRFTNDKMTRAMFYKDITTIGLDMTGLKAE